MAGRTLARFQTPTFEDVIWARRTTKAVNKATLRLKKGRLGDYHLVVTDPERSLESVPAEDGADGSAAAVGISSDRFAEIEFFRPLCLPPAATFMSYQPLLGLYFDACLGRAIARRRKHRQGT